MNTFLHLKAILPVNALSAGHFVSRGIGTHADRILDSFEIIYVSSGTLFMQEEGIDFEIKKGQAFILFPHRHHRGTRQFDRHLSFYWLHFLIDKTADSEGEHIMSLPQIINLAKPEQFVELFRRFIKRQENNPENMMVLNLILLEILCELSESIHPIKITNQKMVLASSAEHYIKLHLDEPLSTSLIAEALDCNPDYLGRIFNQVYNKTLTQAIHEHRHNKASQLLIESTYNINEIAYRCGYPDVGYFRRSFKKERGISPNEYRKTYCLVTTDVEL